MKKTYEGADSSVLTSLQELERSVLSCLLWEDTFYENGLEITERISKLIPEVNPELVKSLAIKARNDMKLRKIPLFLIVEMLKYPSYKENISKILPLVVQRPDELITLLELYWKDCKKPIPSQLKKGIAKSFVKFDGYQLKKYIGMKNNLTLRDVMFLTHPKPINGRNGYVKDVRKFQENLPELNDQELNWKMLADNTLPPSDTWEHNLSEGADKKETFERLLSTNKLGSLALLKNIRNMVNAGVDISILSEGIRNMNVEKVFPYRFITASKYSPSELLPYLEEAMFKSIKYFDRLKGRTVLLVDVSGSMDCRISSGNNKKESNKTDRIDVACGLAILLKEICNDIKIYTFSNNVCYISDNSRGFKMSNDIINSQYHSSTYLGKAIRFVNRNDYDRLIIITDEQSHDNIPKAVVDKSYIINVAPYRYGIGYDNYVHINGWSESIILWMSKYEKEFLNRDIRDTEYR